MRHEITLLSQQATNTLNALAGGSVEFCNADYSTVFLSRTLQTPAGTISTDTNSATITITGLGVSVTFVADGTITRVRYKNSSGIVKVDELIAGPLIANEPAPDVQVDNPTVVTGQTGTLNTLTIVYT